MPSLIIDKEITHGRGPDYLVHTERIKQSILKIFVINLEKFSMIYWDDLLDFTILRKRVRIINRGHEFNHDILKRSFESIYYFKENSHDDENKEFLNEIKKSLRFNHPELKLCIERIIDELGGLKNYIGVHIERRIGDEMFRIKANNTIERIFEQVNYYFLNEKFNNTKCQHPVIFLATDARLLEIFIQNLALAFFH
ncbi:35852_t:CDS:2 [Gigaspora margarita]|uniref:35852_t:CDS:1 n=1 Tax=Gigaspora margarita TaxID=4874 RepID=A0ABN7VB88_GIGMA|nr:35852_t:CDS:2 [Gigaspora margarita]